MLRALYAAWDDAPPAHLQLARIASMLGAVTGAKAPTAPRARTGPQAQPTDDEAALLASMPTAPLPRYLTPDEYLAQRDADRE